MEELDQYLEDVLSTLEVSEDERIGIDQSFGYLEGKLYEEFKNRLEKVEIFGSYERNTNLPISIDSKSDVDVLVVFKTNNVEPQTFLKHIRDFADKRYSRSVVAASYPAVVIQLTHARFELVPSYKEDEGFLFYDWQLKIPAPRSEELKWITTNPARLKQQLEKKDEDEGGYIRPLVRLIKYLNVLHGKPFVPFRLEQHLIGLDYEANTMRGYFFEAIKELPTLSDKTTAQNEFVSQLAHRIHNLEILIKYGMADYAMLEIQKLFLIDFKEVQTD